MPFAAVTNATVSHGTESSASSARWCYPVCGYCVTWPAGIVGVPYAAGGLDSCRW